MADSLKALKDSLGNVVTTNKEDCFRASFDGLKLSFIPDAVVRPTSPNDVGTLLRLANEYKVPVTTRGAGSSLTGSAAPVDGGWVLDLSLLTDLRVDPLNSFAYAQAGVITEAIQKAATEHDLYYPPDPASKKFCTIGGNIACNAGGLSCVKYGVTRDYVVALQGFLPTGEPVSWGKPLRKYASGYNLRDLWVGSEGTLGVVTQATLKLIPKPQSVWTALAAFPNESLALAASRELLSLNLIPSTLEFLDRHSVYGVEHITGETVFKSMPGRAVLLVELDGHPDQVAADKQLILKWASEFPEAFWEAQSESERETLWHVRRQCSSAMFQHGNAKLNEDVVVPLHNLELLVNFVQNLSERLGLMIPVFGHAGDGNLHVNVMYNREDLAQTKQAEAAVQSIMHKVVDLDGAITGEHGIGLAKSSFLHLQHTQPEIAAMLAVKKALDPNNILNPGKIFEPFQPWEHTPVAVKLPWDHA